MSKNKTESVVCAACGNNQTHLVFKHSLYPIVSCNTCGLTYLSPRPTAQAIKKIYSHEYFERGHVGSGYTDYAGLRSDLHKEAQRRLKLINNYIQTGKLLDAGCGQGDFLTEAKNYGFSVTGCDIASSAISYVKKTLKLPAIVAPIALGRLPKGPFDVISSWDVIEHMTDPIMSLRAFHQVQKKGGYLFMTTPDINSIDARILGKFWYGFKRIPEHLYYFSPITMKRMLEDAGYEMISIRPWGFQRNLAYCIDQLGRYSKLLHTIFAPFSKLFKLDRFSLFFPFIDMMVIARRK